MSKVEVPLVLVSDSEFEEKVNVYSLGVCPLTPDTLGRTAGIKNGPVPLVPKSETPERTHKVCVSTPGSSRKLRCWFIILLLHILFGGRLCRILNLNQMKAIPWVSGSRAALGACGWVTPHNYTSVGKAPEPRMLVGGGCLASHLLSPTWLGMD